MMIKYARLLAGRKEDVMERAEKKVLWYCVSTGVYDLFPIGVNPNDNREATGLTWVKA